MIVLAAESICLYAAYMRVVGARNTSALVCVARRVRESVGMSL